MVGTAISQAARSSLQVLYWMCFFGPSWDVDYTVFKFAKVKFKELWQNFFSFFCDKMQLHIVGMRAAHNDLSVKQFCLPPDITIRLDKLVYDAVLL